MADRYAFGAFVLDAGTRELRRDDQLIPLTPKAFDLLQVLVASGGVALEKQGLMKSVWTDSYVGEETLTQNIATLRRALGDVAERPQYIVTVPRHGYRFAAEVRTVPSARHDSAAVGPATLPRDARFTAGIGIGALLVIAAVIAVVVVRARPAPSDRRMTQFEIPAPPGTVFNPSASHPAVSPDGRTIAFLAGRPGEHARIWLRPLESLTARELPGTAGAFAPFWSPDSRFLGFFAEDLLKTIAVSGGAPQVVCEVSATGVRSGSWNANGVILFNKPDGIYRTSANGGGPTRLTTVRSGEAVHVLPQFLPDGRHFVYTSQLGAGDAYESWIVLRSLDAADDRRLFSTASQALYAGGDELLFVRSGRLHVQRFDFERLSVKGDPVIVGGLDSIGVNSASARGMFGASHDAGNAILAYRAAPAAELSWFDRRGTPLGRFGEIGDRTPAISHDGTRVAVVRTDGARSTRAIWILDIEHGVASKATEGRWVDCPAWSPNDSAIVFARGVPNSGEIFQKSLSDGTEAAAGQQRVRGCPMEWSSDGRYVLYASDANAQSPASSMWLLPMGRIEPPRRLEGTGPAGPRGAQGRLSPNGRWLAYETDGAGRREIVVRAFPDGTRTWQVSTNGGIEPQWSADGKELFFLAFDRKLMSVPVTTEGDFRPGAPVALFQTALDAYGIPINGRNQYVVSPDRQRFLLKQARPDAPPAAITVVMNWRSLVK